MSNTITSNVFSKFNNQLSSVNNTQTTAKPSESKSDSFVSKHKNKIIVGSAIIGIAALITTAVAYLRGKALNVANGNESKLFSNISEGFKTFFGKGKEAYQAIINKNDTEISNKPIVEPKNEPVADKLDTPKPVADKIDTPKPVAEPTVNKPIPTEPTVVSKTSSELSSKFPYDAKKAHAELDIALADLKKRGLIDDNLKPKSLEELTAEMTDIEESQCGLSRNINGKIKDRVRYIWVNDKNEVTDIFEKSPNDRLVVKSILSDSKLRFIFSDKAHSKSYSLIQGKLTLICDDCKTLYMAADSNKLF